MIDIWISEEADLHETVYRELLKSILATRGSKQEIAQHVGISTQYLSYILSGRRRPGKDVAARLARALPVEASVQSEILEHIRLASEKELRRQRTPQRWNTDWDVPTLMSQLGTAHHIAEFRADPTQASELYRKVKTVGEQLFNDFPAREFPEEAIELCFLLHDVCSILNLNYNALYYANYAEFMIEILGETNNVIRTRKEQAMRAKSRTYRSLKYNAEAYSCCERALEFADVKNNPSHKLFLCSEKLAALPGKMRFTISEASGLATQIHRLCHARGDDFGALWSLSADYTLAKVYITYGNAMHSKGGLKKAMKIITPLLEKIDKIPVLGPIHRAKFLETHARIQHIAGDREAWKLNIGKAIRTAHEAGLHYQLSKIKFYYGDEVNEILEQLNSNH